MQIVIDIPDEQIEKCLEESKYIHENEGEKGFVDITLLYTNKSLEFVDIVRKHDFYSLKTNYKILPKGHGDIVDIEHLIDMFWDGNSMEITKYDLSVIEPIIEADRESEDKK